MPRAHRPPVRLSLVQHAAGIGGLLAIGAGVTLVLWMILGAGGCSFAPLADGSGGGVLGFKVAADGTVDTGGLSNTLLTAGLVGLGVGVPGAGGIAMLIGKFVKAVSERANLQGQNAGWEAREQAASVQAPLPGPVAFGAAVALPNGMGVAHGPPLSAAPLAAARETADDARRTVEAIKRDTAPPAGSGAMR